MRRAAASVRSLLVYFRRDTKSKQMVNFSIIALPPEQLNGSALIITIAQEWWGKKI